MINANITNYRTVHSGAFSINIVFDRSVTDFTKSDITLRAESGNGITDLTFSEITGAGSSYMLSVAVPTGVAGAFSVQIDGQVSVSGVSQAVDATTRTFNYDTIPNVTTTMKQVDYQANGEIGLRLEFSADVLWFDKTDLRIQRMAGDDPSLMDYYITGSGREYRVVFQPARGTRGAISVDIDGAVQRTSGLMREIVNITPTMIVYDCKSIS